MTKSRLSPPKALFEQVSTHSSDKHPFTSSWHPPLKRPNAVFPPIPPHVVKGPNELHRGYISDTTHRQSNGYVRQIAWAEGVLATNPFRISGMARTKAGRCTIVKISQLADLRSLVH